MLYNFVYFSTAAEIKHTNDSRKNKYYSFKRMFSIFSVERLRRLSAQLATGNLLSVPSIASEMSTFSFETLLSVKTSSFFNWGYSLTFICIHFLGNTGNFYVLIACFISILCSDFIITCIQSSLYLLDFQGGEVTAANNSPHNEISFLRLTTKPTQCVNSGTIE